jgi:hypothetical protein
MSGRAATFAINQSAQAFHFGSWGGVVSGEVLGKFRTVELLKVSG